MRAVFLMVLAMLVVLLPVQVLAQQEANATAKATANATAKGSATAAPKLEIPLDKPQPVKKERTKIAVTVEQKGDDNVGGRLAYHLKELFEKSNIFELSSKDERKIKLMLRTVEEFPGRPNMSSIYSVVFVYSETEGTLKYLLAHDVGFVHTSSVKEDAELLVSKTHEIYSKYSYLFD